MSQENPFFDIFQGKEVPLKQVLAPNEGWRISVAQKLREGVIIGQYAWTEVGEKDCILRLAKPVNNGEQINGVAEQLRQASHLQLRLFDP